MSAKRNRGINAAAWMAGLSLHSHSYAPACGSVREAEPQSEGAEDHRARDGAPESRQWDRKYWTVVYASDPANYIGVGAYRFAGRWPFKEDAEVWAREREQSDPLHRPLMVVQWELSKHG